MSKMGSLKTREVRNVKVDHLDGKHAPLAVQGW